MWGAILGAAASALFSGMGASAEARLDEKKTDKAYAEERRNYAYNRAVDDAYRQRQIAEKRQGLLGYKQFATMPEGYTPPELHEPETDIPDWRAYEPSQDIYQHQPRGSGLVGNIQLQRRRIPGGR